mgnify:CR=1 FL=1
MAIITSSQNQALNEGEPFTNIKKPKPTLQHTTNTQQLDLIDNFDISWVEYHAHGACIRSIMTNVHVTIIKVINFPHQHASYTTHHNSPHCTNRHQKQRVTLTAGDPLTPPFLPSMRTPHPLSLIHI